MAILVRSDEVFHHLSVRNLKELLAEVPDNYLLVLNQVNNLAIYPELAEGQEICLCFSCLLGVIDLGDESVEWFAEKKEAENGPDC